MNERVIISLTTWGERIGNIPRVLNSIFAQTKQPHAIVLNIADDVQIPADVASYIDSHKSIIVNRVEDTKVWKKFIPTFSLFPNDCIICIDDDFVYPQGMIEDFMRVHKNYPNNPISGNRVKWFSLDCHCGCASLVMYKWFKPILRYIDDDVMANCKSSDYTYTYLLASIGIKYVHTGSLYFKNMQAIESKGAWTSNAGRLTNVPDTHKYLIHKIKKVSPKPIIFACIPYNSDKNLGKAYNDFANLVPNDAWICFFDADTLITTSDYGTLMENIIMDNPQADAFTCVTNRVGCKWQIADGVDWDNDDIAYHRQIGAARAKEYGTECEDVTDKKPFSGLCLLIRKDAWTKIGGAKEDGMLGIDNDLHKRIRNAGLRLYLAKGLYLYHWYRGGDKKDTTHLI